jgi:ubiquinone/menaquinone biosynthesis C-methylase UbiE
MSPKEYLYKIYGFAKNKIVPDLKYSQELYEDVLTAVVGENINWLDLGCGHQLLPQWRFEQEKALVGRAANITGIDFDFPSLTKHQTISNVIQGKIDSLPFKDDYFDVATANMVVEHLDNPGVQFSEVNRVLKPGGIFIFHTPNEFGYFSRIRKAVPEILVKKMAKMLDDRDSEDVFEVHYKANSREKIQAVAEKTNFAVEKVKYISSDAVASLILPVAVAELLWIKILMAKRLSRLRTNLIVILRKGS